MNSDELEAYQGAQRFVAERYVLATGLTTPTSTAACSGFRF